MPEAEAPLKIFEDRRLLVLAKPFGMPSQPDPSGDLSLLDWARQDFTGELFLIHRLDRPTGGVVILAKTRRAAAEWSEAFREREVAKTYLAVTDGPPEPAQGELSHYIGKLPGKNYVRAYDNPVRNSKQAHLTYRSLAAAGPMHLLEIRPTTGRRHQIRAQLKRIGLAILGDKKYGRGKPLDYPGIALWAHRLESARGNFEAPPPRLWPWTEFPKE